MAELDQLVAVQQAHHVRFLGVQDATAELIGEQWDTFAGLDDVAAAQFEAAASVVIDTAKRQTSTLAVGYMNANDRLGGFPASGLVPVLPEIRNGVPVAEVYHRSIVEARARVANGATFEEAMRSGRARAVSTARTDVSLANKGEMARGGELRPWVVGYRRVLTGRSCAFCATASTQRYKSADLLPLHPSCDCDVAEIFGTEDPGHIINGDLLAELKKAGRADGRPDYWDGPYVVDADGAIRYRKIEKLLDADGNPIRLTGPSASGRPRYATRTTAGDRVQVEVVNHGELGPMLTDAKHATTTAPEIPSTSTGSSSTPPRRTRSTAQDPDVLAEARRRNVSPDRVIELREQKAQRRYLEDRARREAAKAIDATDPDVIRLAQRFGVDPDELLSARARVADVRKIAREEAARVQARALSELDRLDSVRLANPPRKITKGTGGRRGEWDWLEQISDREKARLSRSWYGGTQTPDQFAANMANALSRDVSVDDAADLWLRLNREAEASGALRRGKIPSLDAYSGQIDVADLLPDLTGQGYDASLLFGDDLTAAGHIASTEADLVRREALDYLGDAVNAIEGPSPYRMGFQQWEEEVRQLEYLLRDDLASSAERARYRELVPQYLDAPGLDFEDLYARIISTARKAGEEVPDYARIPWE